MNDPRLEHLLDRYFDEALTAEEADELNQAILSSPRVRELFWQRQKFHAGLRQWGEQAWGQSRSVDLENTRLSRAVRWRTTLLRGTVLACAALLMLSAAIWWNWRERSPAEPMTEAVAVLTRMVEAQWGDERMRRAGDSLSPGWLHLRSGLVQVEFISGARVVIEGPADFEILSAMGGSCARGKLSAEVPPQARGFSVRAAGATIVDLGTSFGLEVGPTNRADVKVLKGEIQIKQNYGPKQNLVEGQAMRMTPDGGLRDLGKNAPSFASVESLNDRFDAGSKRREERWQATMAKLVADPHLLMHYDFATAAPWSRTLINRVPSAAAGTNASLVGCRWAEGRWPGKGALEFHGVTDRVRFTLDGSFEELTLAAWVRVDSLDLDLNGLMMAEGFPPGAVHWQLTRSGQVRLGIRGGRPLDTDTAPVFTREHFGQWTHLAVVCDRPHSRVLAYIDGRLAASAEVKMTDPLRIGNAELGNWNPGAKHDRMPVRNLNGRMDEFLVFDRTLGANEIADLAQTGSGAE